MRAACNHGQQVNTIAKVIKIGIDGAENFRRSVCRIVRPNYNIVPQHGRNAVDAGTAVVVQRDIIVVAQGVSAAENAGTDGCQYLL